VASRILVLAALLALLAAPAMAGPGAAAATPTLTPWIVYGTPTPLPSAASARVLGNKFRPLSGESALLQYSLALPGHLSIRIYSRQGTLVKSFELNAGGGDGEERWDGRDERGATVGAGIYAVAFQGVGLNKVAKVVVIK